MRSLRNDLTTLGDDGEAQAVEAAGNDSLIWRDEPVEREAGLLADCQALVDAGVAEWVETERG